MKEADRVKIKTMPDGIWEGSRPDGESDNKRNLNNITTDIQGNGYPVESPKDKQK